MTEKEINNLFKSFNELKCLIIGDVMVDSYIWGNVNRISPEAPVPIFEVKKRENRLGGAANVALNIQALGATPILCGVIGKDSKGEVFSTLLKDLKLSDEGLVKDSGRFTTSKTRIISASHHLLRVDEEETKNISNNTQEKLWQKIQNLMSQKIDVVIFEDYDKGVLSESLIQKTIALANNKGIPTCVDPKKNNFNFYSGASLFKPNFKEFTTGLKEEINKSDFEAVVKLAQNFIQKNNLQNLLITLSELGMILVNSKNHFHVPAHLRNIADVSGAGDTVISTAALALACGIKQNEIVLLANLAGGLVCEQVGVVPIDKNKLEQEFIKLSN